MASLLTKPPMETTPGSRVTLIYGSHDHQHNSGVALQDHLENQIGTR
ncbi:MAG: hypothetical protein ACRD11_14115 [Terriglobia bacterium]